MWFSTQCVCFYLLILAYNVLAITAPGYKTSLGVHKDEITTKGAKAKHVVYTTVLEYDFGVEEFSNEEFAGLAKQAWDEMIVLHNNWVNSCTSASVKDWIKNSKPGMMSIIGVNKRLYISSSLKRSNPNPLLVNKDATLTRALHICRSNWLQTKEAEEPTLGKPSDVHRTQGSCGEIMATGLVLKDVGKLPWDIGYSRVVAYGDSGNPEQAPVLTNPCNAGDKLDPERPHNPIGCMQWANWQEMEKIRRNTVPKQVDSLVPTKIINMNLNDIWSIKVPFSEAK